MLARWNPWQDLFDVEREMADLTRRFFGTGWVSPSGRTGNGSGWTPAIDVFSRGEDLVVRAELPGVDVEKDVDIAFQDGVLTLRGERRQEQKTEQENYYRVESSYGTFERSIALPRDVKVDDIKATYEDGVLEIVIPKAGELSSAKRIPISVGQQHKALTTEGEKK